MYMQFAGLKLNDATNCENGICVSFWAQGCPQLHHCPGCHNPETWDPNGGQTIELEKLISKILVSLKANGIYRSLSILGGEPIAPYNQKITYEICKAVKDKYPETLIYLWTGYLLINVPQKIKNLCDVIIDGPFIESEKNLSLKLRGSKNQNIYRKIFFKDLNVAVWQLDNEEETKQAFPPCPPQKNML